MYTTKNLVLKIYVKLFKKSECSLNLIIHCLGAKHWLQTIKWPLGNYLDQIEHFLGVYMPDDQPNSLKHL